MPFIFNFGGLIPAAFSRGGFDPTQGNGANPFQRKEAKPRKPRKAIGNAFTRVLINLVVTLGVGWAYFYLRLPAINLHAEEFYAFAFLLCIVYVVCALITSGFQGTGFKGYVSFAKKQWYDPLFCCHRADRSDCRGRADLLGGAAGRQLQ